MNQEEFERYSDWIDRAVIRTECEDRVRRAVARALKNKARLELVARRLDVPWELLAAIQELEASGRMDRHPANGDPLSGRTINKPAGMPRRSEPPYTYESVVSEELEELHRPPDGVWTLAEMCHAAEHFNGTGYRKRGIRTPYVVAATNLEEPGRYVSDHVFDVRAMSSQVGSLALWIALEESGESIP